MQLVIATALFIAGQALIGPTLTPALGSIGLVVLVFASCMLQEKLTWYEYLSPPTHCISHDLNSSLISLIYLGIFIMTGSVVMLGFSKMVIKQAETDFLEPYFLLRVTISWNTNFRWKVACLLFLTKCILSCHFNVWPIVHIHSLNFGNVLVLQIMGQKKRPVGRNCTCDRQWFIDRTFKLLGFSLHRSHWWIHQSWPLFQPHLP